MQPHAPHAPPCTPTHLQKAGGRNLLIYERREGAPAKVYELLVVREPSGQTRECPATHPCTAPYRHTEREGSGLPSEIAIWKGSGVARGCKRGAVYGVCTPRGFGSHFVNSSNSCKKDRLCNGSVSSPVSELRVPSLDLFWLVLYGPRWTTYQKVLLSHRSPFSM